MTQAPIANAIAESRHAQWISDTYDWISYKTERSVPNAYRPPLHFRSGYSSTRKTKQTVQENALIDTFKIQMDTGTIALP